jgi:membrane associated rhomboid family serine protease
LNQQAGFSYGLRFLSPWARNSGGNAIGPGNCRNKNQSSHNEEIMFPLRDENPIIRTPLAIILLIGLNLAAWALIQGFGSAQPLAWSLCEFGLIPGDLLDRVPVGTIVPLGNDMGCKLEGNASALTLVTHMFLHGGWFHIIGNMWFLWVFGDNVEDAMGPVRFLMFYLLCGLAAAATQIMTDPAAAIPMVGASGAIGGVMGAYARLYPHARIQTLIFLGFYVTTVAVPAIGMLGYWFFIQLAGGFPALQGAGGGVAFWAHIGGFLAGLILVGPMHRPDYLAEHLRHGS